MFFQTVKSIANNTISKVLSLKWPFKPQTSTPEVHKVNKTIKKNLSPEEQDKLEDLCRQLLKRKDLLTSGKFQFVGLNQVIEKLGKRWKSLSNIVYRTVEDVIENHVEKGDIFIRYNDESYVIIFASASPEESKKRTTLIAEEIRRRLFDLNEEELRNIHIRETVNQLKAESMMKPGFLGDMFDAMDDDDFNFENPTLPDNDSSEVSEKELLEKSSATEIDTKHQGYNSLAPNPNDPPIPTLTYSYIPLWDIKRRALSTYICLGRAKPKDVDLFQAHQTLYEKRSLLGKLTLDQAILKLAAKQLKTMKEDGQKFFVACPVQHETVFDAESYKEYEKTLAEIPLSHRQFLFLFVINMENTESSKNPYWFCRPLRAMCPALFVETPLRTDINFSYLQKSGVDAVGVRLENTVLNEQETITLLNRFRARANSFKIPQTFVLDVPSLSIATSAIGAGFDFLGGKAIHEHVDTPDNAYMYQYDDLIKKLMVKKNT